MPHLQLANAQAESGPANKSGGKDLFRTQFMKTKYCQFYLQGRCRHGDDGEKCAFSHGTVEIPPDLTKTSRCKKFKAGKCSLSSANCPFAHSEGELRATPLFVQKRRARDAKPIGLISDVPSPPPVSDIPSVPISCALRPALRPGWQPPARLLRYQQALPAESAGVASRNFGYFANDGSVLPPPSAHNASSALDLLEPMKVRSDFFVGHDDVDPFEPVKVIANRWAHWEVDTAIGETRSDDESSNSSLPAQESSMHNHRPDFHAAGFHTIQNTNSGAGYSTVSGMSWW